ncbi:hypothetical protein DPEC_G00021750 [Dallia pectoralis]|uniref:Uncharacterized protein n=1 Tax=Dallia pectoralis TaxID=75939 RepID=A0ACC2HH06_DALPE|nr:hypothetical protein DPEC_G00021750 [Dallia pectoralis]
MIIGQEWAKRHSGQQSIGEDRTNGGALNRVGVARSPISSCPPSVLSSPDGKFNSNKSSPPPATLPPSMLLWLAGYQQNGLNLEREHSSGIQNGLLCSI